MSIAPHKYRPVQRFFQRPKGVGFIDVADVATDRDDNVYVFSRSAHPVMIFDRNGDFLEGWGDLSERYFTIPHGITIDSDGYVYTVDVGDHTVRKWTPHGKLETTIGHAHRNAPLHSGEPFNRPTKAAISSTGDIYVSDGYGNSRVQCFDASGSFKFSWGDRGLDDGQFDLVHGVYIDQGDGDAVYVSDRYNNRVQIFTPLGEYVDQIAELRLPNGICRSPDGHFYIAELSRRVTVLDADGEVVSQWGADEIEPDDSPVANGAIPDSPARGAEFVGRVRTEPGAGLFCAPHGIACDSTGAFYVAEVAESYVGLDRGDCALQKFVIA
jgi:DNA-binding beta-propeller fold protein YncE